MTDDRELLDYEAEKRERKGISRKIDKRILIGAGIILIFIFWFIYIRQPTPIQLETNITYGPNNTVIQQKPTQTTEGKSNVVYLIGGIIAIILLVIYFSAKSTKDETGHRDAGNAKKILFKDLHDHVKIQMLYPEGLPDGKINIGPTVKPILNQSNIKEWVFVKAGFNIEDTESGHKKFFHAYLGPGWDEGTVGIQPRTWEYVGDDAEDYMYGRPFLPQE